MSDWHRLADYFVVVAYEPDQDNGGCGKVIQRFPEADWPDCPFTSSIELFCQPTGWSLSEKRCEPTFFVSVLTDVDREFHYASCLTFYEPYKFPVDDGEDEEDDMDSACNFSSSNPDLVPHSNMFAPKSLIILSQLNYFETYRNCLGIIYSIYVDGFEHYNCSIEDIIGNMLGCICAPTSGGVQIKFSVGAGDRQTIQPPLQDCVPTTRNSVAILFQELGIYNSLKLLAAALTDNKILFISQSCSRLVDASHSLTSLMFPLKYSYVYIPLLPALLVEVLNTPTPFIAGIHSSLSQEASELLDVIVVDLDGGSVRIPEGVQIPPLPELICGRATQSLMMILKPDLLSADLAFRTSLKQKNNDLYHLDKEIRAVFIRFFAELFYGYRACLQIIRIHPDPVIHFHKAKFLGLRGFVEDAFLNKLLDSMCFQSFIHTRGVPFRVCDVFDEIFATFPEQLLQEKANPDCVSEHVQSLATTLYLNENCNTQAVVDKVPQPTEGAYKRVHLPTFPTINWVYTQTVIENGLIKQKEETKRHSQLHSPPKRNVPTGSLLLAEQSYLVTQTKRLEVLHNCIHSIFEGKISEARKVLPAVVRTMTSRIARLALCRNLKTYADSRKFLLENSQFDLVVKLINSALQHESPMDENGIGAQIMPLADSFYRKLSTGVMQFAYSLIQEHAVWANLAFWEACFYEDVQQQVRSFYLNHYDHKAAQASQKEEESTHKAEQNGVIGGTDTKHHSSDSNESLTQTRGAATQTKELVNRTNSQMMASSSALEIAAEEMKNWDALPAEEQAELLNGEESIVYSLAVHYINKLMYLRIPMDTRRGLRSLLGGDGETMSMRTTSYAESDLSNDAESGFDEPMTTEVCTNVMKIVTRFVNKVCGEAGVNDAHMKNIHTMIPVAMSMHSDTLESVYREFQRMPNYQKPKIVAPSLLPGEQMLMKNIRVYLLCDGREEGTGRLGGPILLPAEGAIFLTTYRLIFKGAPCEMLASEQTVVRSFPISSLLKEQKHSSQYLPHIDQWIPNVYQFRSCLFQLIKVGFEPEVTEETLEDFDKALNKVRYPDTVLETFAFSGADIISMGPGSARKDKYQTLRGFKKTLLRLPKKAGFRLSKPPARKNKYQLRLDDSSPGTLRRPNVGEDPETASLSSSHHSITGVYTDSTPTEGDNWSMIEESEQMQALHSFSGDHRSLERIAQLLCYLDYERLGLGSLSNQRTKTEFKVSKLNSSYAVCKSYPSLLVLPHDLSEDSVSRFARCHRQNRFPVITWKHPKSRALLLRASAFSSKSARGLLKQHTSSGMTPANEFPSNSNTSELEKYLLLIRSLTPSPHTANNEHGNHGNRTYSRTLTPDSRSLMAGNTLPVHLQAPPQRKGSTKRFNADTLTRGAVGVLASPLTMRHFRKGHSRDPEPFGRLSGFGSGNKNRTSNNLRLNTLSASADLLAPGQPLSRAQLYVLCEKNQVKHLKVDQLKQCDFIPVEYRTVGAVNRSFKKLLRACCPSKPLEADEFFYKQIEETGWLNQLQNLLHLAGATVDLLDIQGSSVIVALEDGSDITAQVVSIAQILLDPYYRTIQGFRTLVEKDWLAFGHRFSTRMTQLASSDSSTFGPVFMQFLDVVHQIHLQFPLSFEFNAFYLKFLAYHSVSNRFRTFMLDCEQERLEMGWLLDDLPRQHPPASDATHPPTSSGMGLSVWDYIDYKHATSPLFYNFSYLPEQAETVLRPHSNLPNIRLWSFYTDEHLAGGSPFDVEVAHNETAVEADDHLDTEDRRIVNVVFDNVEDKLKHSFAYLFNEHNTILQNKWQAIWKSLDCPVREKFRRQYSLSTQYCRSLGQTAHKKSTIDFLVKGKLVTTEANKMFSQPHTFEKYHYTAPASCDYCSHILWGLVKTGLKCTECGYNCHEKCMSHVPKNCIRLRIPIAEASGSQAPSIKDLTVEPQENEVATSHSSNEHRTHEGYLWKQSNFMLKGWKKRWFVLDSVKHQLRYYDSQEDPNCKGFIDLQDVQQVEPTKSHNPGAPKKADENAFFELKTPKRLFVLLAGDKRKAAEWIELIQSKI